MKESERIIPKKNDTKNLRFNFCEVYQNFEDNEAINEASRCLNCHNSPCLKGCVLNNNIPLINSLIKLGKYKEAYEVLIETNPFPSICGRVCQQELQCEKNCALNLLKNSETISIGRLERFLGDKFLNEEIKVDKSKINDIKVAIIGSGPSGLACAHSLIKEGFNVTIFEKEEQFGGLLTYGIPEFCLPRSNIQNIVDKLKNAGVVFKNNSKIETKEDFERLKEAGFDVFFVACGANEPRKMSIEGEDLLGVLSGSQYLKITNSKKYLDDPKYKYISEAKNVLVIGGGNSAIDCDRMALRLGADRVINMYRRSEEEMPARKEEYINALNEDVKFIFLANPTKINGNEESRVISVDCIKMTLGELDNSNRRKPIPIEGSDFRIYCDLVIMALGSTSNNEEIAKNNALYIDKYGYFVVDKETMETSVENFYAGGDCVSGPDRVVSAIKDGLKVAKAISKKYKKNS